MRMSMFSDEEALRIAAQIERKGARFYQIAQALSESQQMTDLLEMLRQQELVHAEHFERLLDELLEKRDLSDEPFDEEANAFLSALAADVVFPGGVMASMMNRKIDTIPDLLLYAISAEKDSILFYMELIEKTRNPQNIPIFREIVAEERKHMEDLQTMLEDTRKEGL